MKSAELKERPGARKERQSAKCSRLVMKQSMQNVAYHMIRSNETNIFAIFIGITSPGLNGINKNVLTPET